MGEESTTFESCVNAPDGRPFVRMTCALDGVPVFAVNMSPAVVTALGLRAIQTGIEAERDAGFVAFLREHMEADEQVIGGLLSGMREHREHFDSDTASTRKLSPEDTSFPTELEDDGDG